MRIRKESNISMFLMLAYIAIVSILNYTNIYLIAAALFVGFTFIFSLRKNRIYFNSFIIFNLILIIYEIFFTYAGHSVNTSISFSIINTLILNFLINIAMFLVLNDKEKIYKVIKFYYLFIILGLIFIIIYTGGTGAEGRLAQNMPRPFSSTGFTGIEVGMLAVWGSISSLFLYFKEKKKKFLIPQVLFWIVIIWSGSRDCCAFGLVVDSFLYFLCGKNDFFSKLKKLFYICIIALLGLVIVMKVPLAYNIIGYRFEGYINKTEMSALSRDTMKDTAVKLIKVEPIWGYGIGTFQTFSGSFGTWAHNNYLELMVGGGIVLTIVYYIPIITAFFKILLKKNKDIYEKFAFSLIVLALLHSLFGVTYLSRMGNIFLVIAIATINIDKRNNEDRDGRI